MLNFKHWFHPTYCSPSTKWFRKITFFPVRQGCCQRNSARTDDFREVIEVHAHTPCEWNSSECFPYVYTKNFVNLVHDTIWKLIQRLIFLAIPMCFPPTPSAGHPTHFSRSSKPVWILLSIWSRYYCESPEFGFPWGWYSPD